MELEKHWEDKIDVVYPFAGDDVDGIKASIESLRTFGQGLGTIFVAGPVPVAGKGIMNVLVEDDGKPSKNIMKKIKMTFEATEDDRLLLMNDDFFFTKPVDLVNFPYYYCGEIQKYYGGGNRWHAMCENTRKELLKWGYGTKNFGMHVPFIYERDKFMSLWDRYFEGENEYSLRILYGNMFVGDNGVALSGDVKTWKNERVENEIGCYSTSEPKKTKGR